ncbi:MAG: hypothetical protein AMXMBFR59_09510 [Rhodanobacteraceae bacterium]
MDVAKPKAGNRPTFGRQYVLVATVVLALVGWAFLRTDARTVQRSDITVAQVMRGPLDVVVEGYGKLQSKELQLVTAYVDGTVKELRMKAGDPVTESSVIAVLQNPALQELVDNANIELEREQGNLRQLAVNQKREILDEKSKIAELTAQFKIIEFERQAQQELAASGILSKLEVRGKELQEMQLRDRLEFQTQSFEQLRVLHQEATSIQLDHIRQKQLLLQAAQARVNGLTVQAGFEGVLQEVPLEVGKSVAAGDRIALVGSTKDLVAILRIPQNKAYLVKAGQPVSVKTRQDEMQGAVTRVDPGVIDNAVSVEIAFSGPLPVSARPQLNIDGSIVVEKLSDVLFMRQPANAAPSSTVGLFKLRADERGATRTPVRLGREAGLNVEILSGAALNDKFIVSDTSAFGDGAVEIRQ